MQVCIAHFDQIRDALKLRGIWHLQAQTKDETESLVKLMNEGGEPEVFDSLLFTQLAIYDQAVEQAGEYLMIPDDAGNSLCPLCEMLRTNNSDPAQWINGAADDVLDAAQDEGLIPRETRQ